MLRDREDAAQQGAQHAVRDLGRLLGALVGLLAVLDLVVLEALQNVRHGVEALEGVDTLGDDC